MNEVLAEMEAEEKAEKVKTSDTSSPNNSVEDLGKMPKAERADGAETYTVEDVDDEELGFGYPKEDNKPTYRAETYGQVP